jgi:hypothetical protein
LTASWARVAKESNDMWSSLVCAAGEVGASDGWHASRRTEPYGVTRRL